MIREAVKVEKNNKIKNNNDDTYMSFKDNLYFIFTNSSQLVWTSYF